MSTAEEFERHSVTQWYIRQYERDPFAPPESDGLNYDKDGNVTNKVVWEDPKIRLNENFNVITDTGKQMMWSTIFGLTGSGTFLTMAYGASSASAVHTDTHLTYEHILDGTRIPLTNQSATQMTQGSVVSLSTFTDSSFSPAISYYTAATVMGTINGATSLNVNQPIQEFGIASNTACPGTPTGTSGTLFNHYILGASTTLTSTTTLQIIVIFRA